jgi:transcriptional regulator with XRE-family HTH domain
MKRSAVQRDTIKLLVLNLRRLRGLSQREFSEVSGTNRRLLSLYERGLKTPRASTLERLAKAAGLSAERLAHLKSVLEQACEEVALQKGKDFRPVLEASSVEISLDRQAAALTESLAAALKPLLRSALSAIDANTTNRPREKTTTAILWDRFSSASSRSHRALLEDEGETEFDTLSFCERLCEESQRAADPRQAFEWAELALLVAERIPCEEPERRRLQGYAWGFVARSHRAAGDLVAAGDAEARSANFSGASLTPN